MRYRVEIATYENTHYFGEVDYLSIDNGVIYLYTLGDALFFQWEDIKTIHIEKEEEATDA